MFLNHLRLLYSILKSLAELLNFHCARHTFGCLQVEAGTNLMVIQRLMGHKNFSTTEIYAKMSDEQIRATVNCVKLK
ncbi:MAG: tyrosine-type recombinase/integrase [Bacteroidales bacterium]|nr:tyrosine-type recombinase/integrase [Bacteroidales bacterium]